MATETWSQSNRAERSRAMAAAEEYRLSVRSDAEKAGDLTEEEIQLRDTVLAIVEEASLARQAAVDAVVAARDDIWTDRRGATARYQAAMAEQDRLDRAEADARVRANEIQERIAAASRARRAAVEAPAHVPDAWEGLK